MVLPRLPLPPSTLCIKVNAKVMSCNECKLYVEVLKYDKKSYKITKKFSRYLKLLLLPEMANEQGV